MKKKSCTHLLILAAAMFIMLPAVVFSWPLPDTGQTQSYTKTFGADSDYTINPPLYAKLDESLIATWESSIAAFTPSILTCTYSISPLTQTFAAYGGTGTIYVTASDPDCGWLSISNAPWITPEYVSGNGSGTRNYVMAANLGPARIGTITFTFINGVFTVEQAAAITTTTTTVGDLDGDGLMDTEDNCPNKPNGPNLGTCSATSDKPGINCTSDADCANGCSSNGLCIKDQRDEDNDGVGDVCDTEYLWAAIQDCKANCQTP